MLPCSNRHTIVGNCLQSSQNSCAGLILPPTFQQLTSDRMLSRGGFKVRHGLCSANGCLSASAAGGSMAQSGSNVLVTCRSSVRQGRTAASPSCQLEVSTLTGHPDFPEAAAEARWPSVSFAATKLPFVTSRLRPSAARPPLHNPAILMAAGPRNLSLPQARRSAVLIPSDGLVVRRRCRAGRERR